MATLYEAKSPVRTEASESITNTLSRYGDLEELFPDKIKGVYLPGRTSLRHGCLRTRGVGVADAKVQHELMVAGAIQDLVEHQDDLRRMKLSGAGAAGLVRVVAGHFVFTVI
jgi:hypothetical protein